MNQPEETFYKIFGENKGKIWAYIFKKTPTRHNAEEVYQESLKAFAEALKKPKEIKTPEALLWRIVKNKIADFYKHCERLPEMAELDENLIEMAYSQGALGINLYRWPPGISRLERQIIIRKFELGQTYAEMAAELGKSVKALEHLYTRLMQKLNARYAKGRKS